MPINTGLRLGLILMVLLGACTEAVEPPAAGASTGPAADAAPAGISFEQRALPVQLTEISGLTHDEQGRLYAIADEVGVVYRMDFDSGAIEQVATFGDPPIREDFEGLAYAAGDLYATDSKGRIYITTPGSGQYQRIKTRLDKRCEFEGIEVQRPLVWLLCKQTFKKSLKGDLVIYAWNTATGELDEDRTIQASYESLQFKKKLAPSGLAWLPQHNQLLIIAAQQRAYVRITTTGELVQRGFLPAAPNHAQAEGVTVIDGAIYVGDEAGAGPATLSRYANGF